MEGITRVKSRKFAVRIVRLYQFLCNERKEFVLSKQLLRSGTGIGANLAEAECAISKKDFLSKIYIALKECSETLYWLDLLKDTSFPTLHSPLSTLHSPLSTLHSPLSTLHSPASGLFTGQGEEGSVQFARYSSVPNLWQFQITS